MPKNDTIERLRERVQQIIADNRLMRSEVTRLRGERDRLAHQRRQAEQHVIELEQRVKTLETAASFAASGGDNHQARLRINRLLREIDGCIALMNK